jgi:hypothetical protein
MTENTRQSENKRLAVAKFRYPEKFLKYISRDPDIRRVLTKISWSILEGKQNQEAYDNTLQEEYVKWLRK